jgi:protein phosphatase 1 regulatory subunit 11
MQATDVKQKVRTRPTEEQPPRQVLYLRLRPEPTDEPPRHVTWDGEVKENKNQRTSKKCCVFHKKRLFGESDTESSGSEDERHGHNHKCSKEHCHCGTRFA